jgi:hypothetical protein
MVSFEPGLSEWLGSSFASRIRECGTVPKTLIFLLTSCKCVAKISDNLANEEKGALKTINWDVLISDP